VTDSSGTAVESGSQQGKHRLHSPFMRVRSLIASLKVMSALVIWLGTVACSSGGLYGHAAHYAPVSGEERASSGAKDYDPVMVQRQPDVWHASPVSLFGVVVSRSPGPSGTAYLTLTVRRLEPRNLCEYAADESSCRTTVSDKDFGVVHAAIALRPEDDIGEHSVGIGSLLRLVGKLAQDPDPTDGNSVVRPTFYRHWPRYFYATRANAESMRQ
jgi:hypothetical protein